jgi:Uma2 family endonuclease
MAKVTEIQKHLPHVASECNVVWGIMIARKLARLIYMTTLPIVKSSKPTTSVSSTVKVKRNPTIEDFKFRDGLPTAEELPDSDDKPVESELQELVSGLLKAILLDIWRDRTHWIFGLDLGFYYDPDQPAIAPDGFLSLGVEEIDDECLRSSYVLWDEKVIPLFALEIISRTPGKEHTKKFKIYQSTGILYYLVYAPLRKRKAKFQLYKLIEGEYVLQSDGRDPYWMPEIGLAIGMEKQRHRGRQREWLFWYDENQVRYPTPIERAEAEANLAKAASERADIEARRANAESERADIATAAQVATEQKNNALRQRLRELGIDPDSIG